MTIHLARRGAIAASSDPAPATEWSFTFSAPTIPDAIDGAATYTLGVKFHVTEALPCIGVEWFTPLTAAGAVTVGLWNVAAPEVLLASKSATITTEVGVLHPILFDAPVSLSVGPDYMAGVFTARYTATSLHAWPRTDGPLVSDASNGWYLPWGVMLMPNNVSAFANNYHVSPILQA